MIAYHCPLCGETIGACDWKVISPAPTGPDLPPMRVYHAWCFASWLNGLDWWNQQYISSEYDFWQSLATRPPGTRDGAPCYYCGPNARCACNDPQERPECRVSDALHGDEEAPF